MNEPTRLSSSQMQAELSRLPGWQVSGNEIAKLFQFKDYYETLAFVNASAWISHRMDHHPDLEVSYNQCKVRYSTHSAGGITAKDIECAGKIEKMISDAPP